MASLNRAKNVLTKQFGVDSVIVGAGYSGARVLTEVIRSEVVDLQFPMANAVYSLLLAGAVRFVSGSREARMASYGMVASGISTAWSDFAAN